MTSFCYVCRSAVSLTWITAEHGMQLLLYSVSWTVGTAHFTQNTDSKVITGDRDARQPHILCSICVHSLWALMNAVGLFIASLHNQPMYPKMYSIGIFDNIQKVGWNLIGCIFDAHHPVCGVRKVVWGREWAHSIASVVRPWVPAIFSLHWHILYMVYIY